MKLWKQIALAAGTAALTAGAAHAARRADNCYLYRPFIRSGHHTTPEKFDYHRRFITKPRPPQARSLTSYFGGILR